MSRLDPIAVTLVTGTKRLLPLDGETVLLRLPANTGHGHVDGDVCPACAALTDVRALLYNLLEESKQGVRPPFRKVLVDASAVADPSRVVDALTGRLPAQALRDHAVARLFYLAGAA